MTSSSAFAVGSFIPPELTMFHIFLLVLSTLAALYVISIYMQDDWGTDWDHIEFELMMPFGRYDSVDDVPSVQAAKRLAEREEDDE